MSRLFRNGLTKKTTALLAAFFLVLTLVPFSVSAADPADTMVVHQGETLYYDANGKETTVDGSWVVKLSKTAEDTEIENQFDITLTVEARDSEQIKPRTEPIPVDVVLVFDLSGSMDYESVKFWKALKAASNSFIDGVFQSVDGVAPNVRLSIVGYGGIVNADKITAPYSTNQWKVIQDWTNDPSKAKKSYDYSTAALMRSASPSLSGTFTNCQAGFYGAEVMLGQTNTARPTAGELQYVIYMSDGIANAWYYNRSSSTANSNTASSSATKLPATIGTVRVFQGSGTGDSNAEKPAIDQAGQLKANYPGVKLFTVGLGVDNSKVLKKGTSNNPHVDEYFYGTAITLGNIYKQISETITIESSPWTVNDPMGTYINYKDSSVKNAFVSYAAPNLIWSIVDEATANGGSKFTAKYTVNLDMSNITVWENSAAHETNGLTTLTFNIYENGTYSKTKIVPFDVPTVKANLYTYTFMYYYDNILREASTDVEKYAVGETLTLDGARNKILQDFTLIETTINKVSAELSATIATGADTNNTKVEYYYKSGYALIINYLEENTNKVLASQFTGFYSNGTPYSVTSPEIAGYEFVTSSDSVISGSKEARTEEINVFYKSIPYAVTYKFEGPAPYTCTTFDNKVYKYNESVTVAGDPTDAAGWVFKGWDRSDFNITENTVITGKWEKETYLLDVIYKFASDDDYNDFTNYMHTADDSDAYLELMENIIGEFHDNYTSADGISHQNVFVFQTAASYEYGDPYSFTAANGISDFIAAASGTTAGSVRANTTVVFQLSNNLFEITINHKQLTKDGSYVTVTTDGKSGHGEEPYNVAAKDFSGFHVNDIDGDIGDYEFGSGKQVYNIYYDPDLYNVDFEFTTTDNPDVLLPDSQTDIWSGDMATDPRVTAPEGWSFDGWYTDMDCKNSYDFASPVTDDITLYGAWSRINYTVDFSLIYAYGDGTGDGNPVEINAAPDDQIVAFKATAADPDYTPDYVTTPGADYFFAGWFTDSSCETLFNFDTAITANTSLYGKWTRTTNSYAYTVEHYLDGNWFATEPGLSDQDYGREIKEETAEGYAMGSPKLMEYFEADDLYKHISFKNATGCIITEVIENNIVKVYYTTNKYELTIHYLFESALAPYAAGNNVFVSKTSTVTYNQAFSVDAEGSIENYTARPEWTNTAYSLINPAGTVNVSGKMPGGNLELTVLYNVNARYTYIINYLELGTDKVVDDHYESELIFVNTPYEIEAAQTSEHAVENYTYHSTDGDALSGNMPEGGVVINVYYTRNQANLKVIHTTADGNDLDLSEFNSSTVKNAGDKYEASPLTAPELNKDYKLIAQSSDNAGTSFDENSKASGTMPSEDVTITYVYGLKDKAYITINYLDEEENEIIESKYLQYNEGDTYDIEEYIYDTLGDDGQYLYQDDDADGYTGKATGNIVVNVNYVTKHYDFEVHFINDYTKQTIEVISNESLNAPWGTTLDEAYVADKLENNEWVLSRLPGGYFLNGKVLYPTISAGKNIVEVHYNDTYTPPTIDTTYTLTVNYIDNDTGAVISTQYTRTHSQGSSYDATAQAELIITGYTRLGVNGDNLTGSMNSNKVINVLYSKTSTIGSDTPDADGSALTDFTEEDPPLAMLPPEEDILIELEDDEPPLTELPQTGASTAFIPFAATGLGILGVGLLLNGKKKDENEN